MIGIGITVMKNNTPMKRLLYIFLSLIAILTIGVICCNRAVIKTAEDKMYDDVSAIPYNRVGVLLGTNPKGRRGNPNPFYINRIEACAALYKAVGHYFPKPPSFGPI